MRQTQDQITHHITLPCPPQAHGDGHSFAFSRLLDDKRMSGGGCERPCDDLDTKTCGCVDDLCTGPKPKGEEHNRRWAVYEVLGKGK